jgi:hypothetical protein
MLSKGPVIKASDQNFNMKVALCNTKFIKKINKIGPVKMANPIRPHNIKFLFSL